MIVHFSLLLCFFYFSPASCQVGVCTSMVSTVRMHMTRIQASSLTTYRCGIFNWAKCYRMVYSLRPIQISYLVYHTTSVCCEGYTGDVENCSPLCENCNEPFECVAPSVCACRVSPPQDGTNNCAEPPKSLTLTATGTDSILIQWDSGNPLTTAYFLYRPQGGSSEVMLVNATNHLSIQMDSLHPFTTYTYCVVGYVANLASVPVCASGTTFESVPGDPPHNLLVTILSPSRLRLQWDAPVIPNGVITKYTIHINEIAWKIVDGKMTNSTVENLVPNTHMIVRMSASTRIGEGPLTDPQSITTPESVPGVVQDFKVAVLSENSIRVRWKPPLAPNGVLLGYQVAVGDLNTSTQTIYDVAHLRYQLLISSGIYPFIPYDISVGAKTTVGVGELQRTLIFTREGVPDSSPLNLKSIRTSATTARIEWDPIPLQNLKGHLDSYILQYKEMRGNNSSRCRPMNRPYSISVSTEMERYYTVVELDPGYRYCVRVAAETGAGIGPFKHSLVPLFRYVEFEIIFEVEDCASWIIDNLVDKMDDVAFQISSGVEDVCQCDFSKDYIIDRSFTCDNTRPDRAIYRGKIVSTNERNASDVKTDLEEWASVGPSLVVDGQNLKVFGESSRVGEEEGKDDFSLVIGICVGIAVIITIFLIVAICVCYFFCFYRNKKSRGNPPNNEPPNETPSEKVDYHGDTESKVTKPDNHYSLDSLPDNSTTNKPYYAILGPQDYEESHVYTCVD